MVEVIDSDTGAKMMAMIFAGVQYDGEKYVVYCVRREKEDANVFVSRLVRNSQGYAMDHEFRNGEKEVMEGILQRILNKESKDCLAKDGIQLFLDFELSGILYYDINLCYVSTVQVSFLKECMIYYELVDKRVLERPVVEVKEDHHFFNEGFVGNLFLIFFGICLIGFCIFVVYGVLVRG